MSKLRVNEITDLNDNLLWEASQGVGGATVSTSTGTQTVAGALDQRGPVFDNVADMQAAANLTVGTKVRTLGYYSPGDGGGNDYEIVAAGTGTDDGGSFIDLNGSGLQAKGLFQGFRSLAQFGNDVKSYAIGRKPVDNNTLLIRQVASDDPGKGIAVQIQRLADVGGGLVNPKALRVVTTVSDPVDQTEWAISGEMVQNSNQNSTGFTAVSGVSFKNGTGQAFGGHFQVKDSIRENSSTAGSIVGMECNIQAWGDDDTVLPSGAIGRRIGIDLIARTYDNGPWVFGTDMPARFRAGLRIRNSETDRGGSWLTGLEITDRDSTEPMPRGITINTRAIGGKGIEDLGNKGVGIDLTGTYAVGAIRIQESEYICLEGTSTIRLKYESNAIRFLNGTSERFAFSTTAATPSLSILGLVVLQDRRTGWSIPTGTANRTSFDTATVTLEELAQRVKALIDDLNINSGGHGLIGS